MTLRQQQAIQARITRYNLGYRDLVFVAIFAPGHPQTPLWRHLDDYARGRGPAAVAAGRAC